MWRAQPCPTSSLPLFLVTLPQLQSAFIVPSRSLELYSSQIETVPPQSPTNLLQKLLQRLSRAAGATAASPSAPTTSAALVAASFDPAEIAGRTLINTQKRFHNLLMFCSSAAIASVCEDLNAPQSLR